MDCILEKLIAIVCEALEEDIENIDTHELGMVIDMIKDMSKAIYDAKVVEAMDSDTFTESMMPSDIRSRMYYKNDMSESHIVDDLKMLFDSYDEDGKDSLKQRLVNEINNM